MDSQLFIDNIFLIIIISIPLLFFLLWYFHIENVTGTVHSKWTESNGGRNRRVKNTYLIQMDNGKVYSIFWGTRHFDRINEHQQISFKAHGFTIRLLGWRLTQPTLFGFKS